ncbi:hypothetical protein ONZ45_g14680 [Pleurotus djamor]|nr:hypothetical protein ONZ45_g14680 [Pleurotus djamor]
MLSARKDLPITPSTKMKQLQWDKLAHQQVSKTLWSREEPEKEHEMLMKLQMDGVWMEMEEDFKAKQLVINLMARQKQAELKSVLDPQTKKLVEILLHRVKKWEPEEIARRIQQFDQELCTEIFLSELKPVLPSPEQIGKLNVYRNAGPEELAGLHPSDRLMVQLIKINRMSPRIEGMLYKCKFEETWALLDEGAKKLEEAGQALLQAKNFKELLSLILLIGNYMNGTGVKGGAFGFRVSSINKLVDTKSVNNTTLLHFLERTVAKHFPEMEEFLAELDKPAEAYRIHLQELRKGLKELRDGLQKIRTELGEYFANIDQSDKFGSQMWMFVGRANSKLEDLTDDVNLADTTFTEVIKYYGEEGNGLTSSEFFGVFKTFVTSYKKCKLDNEAAAGERLALEKRKQADEAREKDREVKKAQNAENTAVIDDIYKKLIEGGPMGRRSRRPRPTVNTRPNLPLALDPTGEQGNEVNLALDMLAQLRADGFEAAMPESPSIGAASRRRRRRTEAAHPDSMSPSSPLATEILLEESSSGFQEPMITTIAFTLVINAFPVLFYIVLDIIMFWGMLWLCPWLWDKFKSRIAIVFMYTLHSLTALYEEAILRNDRDCKEGGEEGCGDDEQHGVGGKEWCWQVAGT